MAEFSPQSSHDAIPTGSIFVGRQREMAELKDALDNALAGNGQLVMLAGEPGISKIRTAQELASNAAARSARFSGDVLRTGRSPSLLALDPADPLPYSGEGHRGITL